MRCHGAVAASSGWYCSGVKLADVRTPLQLSVVRRLVALSSWRAPPAVRGPARAAWARRWFSAALQQAIRPDGTGPSTCCAGPAQSRVRICPQAGVRHCRLVWEDWACSVQCAELTVPPITYPHGPTRGPFSTVLGGKAAPFRAGTNFRACPATPCRSQTAFAVRASVPSQARLVPLPPTHFLVLVGPFLVGQSAPQKPSDGVRRCEGQNLVHGRRRPFAPSARISASRHGQPASSSPRAYSWQGDQKEECLRFVKRG